MNAENDLKKAVENSPNSAFTAILVVALATEILVSLKKAMENFKKGMEQNDQNNCLHK